MRLRSALLRVAANGWRQPLDLVDSLNVARHGRVALNLFLLHQRIPPRYRRCDYDVIHAHFGPNGQRAVALRRFGVVSCPVITSFHGYDANQLPRVLGKAMYKDLFGAGELFTAGSDFMLSRLVELGAPPGRLAKLPMGADLAKFANLAVGRKPRAALRVLTVARLVEVKGVKYALEAVAAAAKDMPALEYYIVGDGPLRGELEALSMSLGIADRVHFVGALPSQSVRQHYADADIFLLPSIVTRAGEQESQSVVLVEAQASGLPVIATLTGGVPETVVEGRSGLLVPPRNAASLASAILRLALDPQTRSAMGRCGQRHVEEHYDQFALDEQLERLYRAVARVRVLPNRAPLVQRLAESEGVL